MHSKSGMTLHSLLQWLATSVVGLVVDNKCPQHIKGRLCQQVHAPLTSSAYLSRISYERWCVEKLHNTKCVKSLFYRVNSRLQLRIRCSKRYSAIIENKTLIQSNLLQRSLFMSWRTIRTFYSNLNLSTTITVKVAKARLNWQNNLSNDDKSTFCYWKRSRKLISTKRRSSLFLFYWCILIVSHIYMQQ